jgi:hypothetical protein
MQHIFIKQQGSGAGMPCALQGIWLTVFKMKFKNYRSAIHNFTHSLISIDYTKSGVLAVNVLIDLFSLNLDSKATFDFIKKDILPAQADTKRSRQLLQDYLDWLPAHFLSHNCDLSKLEKLEITFWAGLAQARTPEGFSDIKEFSLHAITKWKAENREEEIIEISQIEMIKQGFLKSRIPEF